MGVTNWFPAAGPAEFEGISEVGLAGWKAEVSRRDVATLETRLSDLLQEWEYEATVSSSLTALAMRTSSFLVYTLPLKLFGGGHEFVTRILQSVLTRGK